MRHQDALAGLFGEVLTLCAKAGLAKVGVIAVDGTKLQANASRDENLDYEQLAREILEEAKAVDAAEDELYGDARGDELPRAVADRRRAAGRGCERPSSARSRARREPAAGAASRPKRLKEAKRRLDEELWSEVRANAAYEALPGAWPDEERPPLRRARRRSPTRRRTTPEGRINVTDPDSRVVKGLRGFIQGYNAQAVTNEHQIVIAAEMMTAAPDFGHLEPMLDAAQRELARGRRHRHAGRAARRRRLLAPAPDGTDRRPGHPGPDPARREPSARARGRAGTAATTRSCAASSRPSTAASSTANASR